MAWTYSGDPSESKLDTVRFLIGDTDADYALLTDEEINFTLELCNDNTSNAAIMSCEGLVAKAAKAVNYSIGPEKVAASDRFKQYQALLKSLVERVGVFTSAPSMQEATYNGITVGLHDNWE